LGCGPAASQAHRSRAAARRGCAWNSPIVATSPVGSASRTVNRRGDVASNCSLVTKYRPPIGGTDSTRLLKNRMVSGLKKCWPACRLASFTSRML
jgi:hypothetical protein